MVKKNPYDPITEDEKKLQAKQKIDRDKNLKEAELAAKKCLNNKDFVKYKEKYAILEELTIESLKSYEEPDVIKYATTVKVMLAKLNQLGLLLSAVNLDNKPRGKK